MAGTTHKFGDINYSIKFDVDNQSIQNLKQSLQEIQKMTTMQYQLLNPNAPKDIQAAYHELAAVKSEAEKIQTALQNAFNVNLGSTNIAKFTENLQAQSVNVKQFGQQLSKIGTIGPSAFRNLNTTLITTNGQLKESNKWLDKMAVTMSNTIRFGISSRIFNNLVGSLEKSWNFARQLDASLNDIRIVTGKSADEMERFAVTANRAAQNLGASTRDFTEAALIYYQQGLSDADANARAEVTLKAANVTGQSAQEVSEQLTAVWNGYQVSASEAEKYIDKLAAVAATTAADLEELSTGMSKVASAAAAMGVPIDELNAQLATIVSVTRQAPESVGTALRTIYARMGDIEAGTDEETTLGNYTEQMRALGVNVLDANGKLRDMGDVITEVGNNWSNMSREQQIALAQVMAGTRQYNNLLALFGNWDMYNDALQTSLSSTGELQRQQDIYMERTEAHLQQLSTQWERVMMAFVDNEGINNLIDGVTSLIKLFANLIESIGGGGNALLMLGSIGLQVFGPKISQSLTSFTRNIERNKIAATEAKIAIDNLMKSIRSGVSDLDPAIEEFNKLQEEFSKIAGNLTEEDIKNFTEYSQEYVKAVNRISEIEKQADLDDQRIIAIGSDYGYAEDRGSKSKMTAVNEALEKINYVANGYTEKQYADYENKGIDLNNIPGASLEEGLLDKWKNVNKEIQDYKKAMKNISSGEEAQKFENTNKKTLQHVIDSIYNYAGDVHNFSKEFSAAFSDRDRDLFSELFKRINEQMDNGQAIFENSKGKQYIDNDFIEGLLNPLSTLVNRYIESFRKELEDIKTRSSAKATKEQETEKKDQEKRRNAYRAGMEGTIKRGKEAGKVDYWLQLASGIGQATTAVNSLKSAFDVFNNDSLTGLEKIIQFVSGLTMGIGLLANGIKIAIVAFKNLKAVQLIPLSTLGTILAIAAAIALVTTAIVKATDKEGELKKKIEESQEALSNARDAYEDLSNTVSNYKDARAGIENLTEGTVEFYDAILKSNEAAQELIEKFNLISGKDYTINSKGLITINEDELTDQMFRAQQEIYRTGSQLATAQADYIEKSNSDSGLPGLYRRLSDSISKELWEEDRNNIFKISPDQLKDIFENNKNVTEVIVNKEQELIDEQSATTKRIQESMDKYSAKIQERLAQVEAYRMQAADQAFRGYGSRADVLAYNEMSTLEQQVAQQSISQQIENNRKESEKLNPWAEALKSGGEWAAIAGGAGALTGIGALLGAVAGAIGGAIGGVAGTYITNAKLDKQYKTAYAVNALGYTEEDGVLYSNGRALSEKEQKDVLNEIQSDVAEAAYESGEYAAKEAGRIILDQMNAAREAAGEYVNEIGQKFGEDSKEYISSAIVAARNGLDFDYNTLNEEELKYVRKQVGDNAPEALTNATPDIEARQVQDLENYNSELSAQASLLGTTDKALKLYTKTMRTANGEVVKLTHSTAVAAAQGYKFNKAYNEGVSTFEDSKDAFKEWVKAAREGLNISFDVADAVAELQTKLEQMLGLEVSADYMEKYAQDIITLFSGTEAEAEKAFVRLQEASFADVFTQQLGMAQSQAEQFAHAIAILKPGATLDAEWSEALINMINNSKMSLEELQNLFAAADIEMPEIDTSNVPEPVVEQMDVPQSATRHYYKGEMPIPDGKGGWSTQKVNYYWDEWTEPYSQAYVSFDAKNTKLKAKETKKTYTGKVGSSGLNFAKSASNEEKSSKSEPKQEELLDEQADRYHRIDTQITKVDNNLSKLQSQQDKLFGSDLIDNLNEQWELLNTQIDNYNIKLAIANNEQEELRKKLATQGVAFNADGTISNYMEAFVTQQQKVNDLIVQYNKLSADEQEKWDDNKTIENAKEVYEQFKENMDRYDELFDFRAQIEQQRQEAIDKQIDIQIEEFNKEIEIRLDMSEAERDWNQFKKRVIDGIKDDDILGNARARLQDFSTYFNEAATGAAQVGAQHVTDILEQLRIMDQSQASSIYGDGINAENNNRQQALEDLQNYYDHLKDDLNGVLDLQEEIHQAFLEEMDEVQEKFQEQIDTYETLSGLIEHDMNVIELVYGEDAYGKLAQYYERQRENNNNQLDFLKQQKDFWYAQMEAADKSSEEWEKARNNWLSAIDELNSKVEDSIQNLQDKYLNAINEIFQDLNNQITNGKGLDYIEEEWELINKNADQYLDTIDATWGIQKLEKKYMDAYDETDSIRARQQIKDIMDEELANLRERDRLTQYDIDRANMRYDIMLKQIALEEAQQNKSKMRLRRDSQGNYRYEFVSDSDEIGKLQDELGDLYNSLYDFDKEHYEENLNQIYELWVEFQEKMAEAAQINDPVKRAEMELLIRQQYEPLLNGLLQDNLTIRENLQESAFQDLAYLYSEDVNHFFEMSDAEKDEIMNGLVPTWQNGLRDMVDAMIGNGGFEPTVRDAMDRLNNKTDEYEQNLFDLQQSAGVVFDDLAQGLDEDTEKVGELIQENEKLIESESRNLQAVKDVKDAVDNLLKQYQLAFEAAKNATTAAHDYFAEINNEAANAAKYVSKVRDEFTNLSSYANEVNQKLEDANKKAASTPKTSSKTGSTSTTTKKEETKATPTDTGEIYGPPAPSKAWEPSTGDTVKVSGSVYTVVDTSEKNKNNPYAYKANPWIGSNQVKVTKIDKGRYYPFYIESLQGDFKNGLGGGWVKLNQLTKMNTGGYTGEWGSTNGRLAILHQKELVLNAADTQNILNAVNIMRGLGGAMLNRLSAVAANANTGTLSNTFEQIVHIDANFPNVQSSHEIEDAINNLMNVASQRIGQKRR